MLEKIEYIFPKNDKSIELFNLIYKLFKDLEYTVSLEEREIHIISSNLKPETVFRLDSNVNEIKLNIENPKYVNLLNKKVKHIQTNDEINKILIKDVLIRLEGHITRVDHTGINLPTKLYSKEEWNSLLKYLSSVSNLYEYPTGELWPFLIPASTYENINEITDFTILREPRLELVYDEYADKITLQIDIETDLSKDEVEKLFPKDTGVYFENLENVFKAIYLDYDEYIDIRLDVRFKAENGNFKSGKWFVTEGKRIIL